MSTPRTPIVGDPAADRLLTDDPFALLIGMLLDQQVPMEWAFRGPKTLSERLPSFDPASIAAMPVDEFETICCSKPAIHRFPAAMAKRIHAVSEHLVEHYDANADAIWLDGSAKEVAERLRALPGYGDEKTKIFLAILAKRFGVAPEGWESVAAPFSDEQPRSVADVADPESLQRVRAWKKDMKAKKKTKQD